MNCSLKGEGDWVNYAAGALDLFVLSMRKGQKEKGPTRC